MATFKARMFQIQIVDALVDENGQLVEPKPALYTGDAYLATCFIQSNAAEVDGTRWEPVVEPVEGDASCMTDAELVAAVTEIEALGHRGARPYETPEDTAEWYADFKTEQYRRLLPNAIDLVACL